MPSKNLEIVDTVEGKGAVAAKGKTIKIHYTGKLTDGKISILRRGDHRLNSFSVRGGSSKDGSKVSRV